MCGIFAYFSKSESNTSHADLMTHRGPDETRKIKISMQGGFKCDLVFHRLVINGISASAGQPFHKDGVYLLANGEIYNHVKLEQDLPGFEQGRPGMVSDCEVILHMYLAYGLEKTISLLDGEFAFCIVDTRNMTISVGRDHVGVRALYYMIKPGVFAVSSELKGLVGIGGSESYEPGTSVTVDQFPNRRYAVYNMEAELLTFGEYPSFFQTPPRFISDTSDEAKFTGEISRLLNQAVTKRLMCDRKTRSGTPAIGAFLSGGFDSSIVAALAQDTLGLDSPIHTFSIGFKDAPDLIAAHSVAEHIGSIHHEYIVTQEYVLSLIPEVIKQIESYDITSVRASTFMYALSRYIRDNFPDIVVLLSGEGPDEASGSYMYFHNAPSHLEFYNETMRLLDDLRYYDCLRGDKSTAGCSLEIRVPFLDRDFLEYYMHDIHPKFKLMNGVEKYILRKSFADWKNKQGRPILPENIIWRPKEAMSDGVSQQGMSWFQIIQQHISDIKCKTLYYNPFPGTRLPVGVDLERDWYREIFNYYYPGCSHLVPYYWLPRWSYDKEGTPVQDPSARVLSVYRA